VRSRYQSVVG
ncbi:zinc-binding dehydrogenase family protein, partial [Vibrio parahaemolyticus VPTS-2010_2]